MNDAATLHCHVLVSSFLQANCYVVIGHGPEDGRTAAVVIDPGAGTADEILDLCRAESVQQVSVAATHGHADHVADAPAVLAGLTTRPEFAGVHATCLIGAADDYRLDDPLSQLPPAFRPLAAQSGFPERWKRPSPIAHYEDQVPPGWRVVPAPGHTEGSTLLAAEGPIEFHGAASGAVPAGTAALFTGDVLFAGSIGRTDLPGGDGATMNRTLREAFTGFADDTVVLAGHGPVTTLGAERRGNPYFRAADPTRY